VSKEKSAKAAWWKNTYFWISAILFVVGVIGLMKGPAVIHDPGQKREDSIVVMLYFAGAVLMFVNGWMSHRQTLDHLAHSEENA
jgi:anti-sigma-K factor RskA